MAKKKFGKKILDTLRTVAPTLARAVGGPLVGTAVQFLSNALLGKADGTDEEIELALANATPADLLELKLADNSFKLEMAKLGIDERKLDYDDMADARERHERVGDREPARLAYLAMLIFTVLVAIVIALADMIEASEFAKVIIATIIGAAIGWVDKAYNFFLGSSRGSQEKTEALTAAVQNSMKKE